jgi:hypothetical protein
MRLVRPHPAFQLLFVLSVLTLMGAFFTGVYAGDACTAGGLNETARADCQMKGIGMGDAALVLAIAGLSLMIGGVGFQVGRAAVNGMAVPPQPMFPGPMQHGAPQQGLPQHFSPAAGAAPGGNPYPGGPGAQGGPSWAGQPPASH